MIFLTFWFLKSAVSWVGGWLIVSVFLETRVLVRLMVLLDRVEDVSWRERMV